MSTPGVITQRTNVISLDDEKAVKQVLVDSVYGLWDVVNNLTRLHPTRRESYRVTIFGSARAKPGHSRMKRPSGFQRRWPRWAATSLPAAARA